MDNNSRGRVERESQGAGASAVVGRGPVTGDLKRRRPFDKKFLQQVFDKLNETSEKLSAAKQTNLNLELAVLGFARENQELRSQLAPTPMPSPPPSPPPTPLPTPTPPTPDPPPPTPDPFPLRRKRGSGSGAGRFACSRGTRRKRRKF